MLHPAQTIPAWEIQLIKREGQHADQSLQTPGRLRRRRCYRKYEVSYNLKVCGVTLLYVYYMRITYQLSPCCGLITEELCTEVNTASV